MNPDVKRLKNRYDLRADGAEVRDTVELLQADAPERAGILEACTTRMSKRDRLFFRQGYLFRAGQNRMNRYAH